VRDLTPAAAARCRSHSHERGRTARAADRVEWPAANDDTAARRLRTVHAVVEQNSLSERLIAESAKLLGEWLALPKHGRPRPPSSVKQQVSRAAAI
jgi:hypothetical protein